MENASRIPINFEIVIAEVSEYDGQFVILEQISGGEIYSVLLQHYPGDPNIEDRVCLLLDANRMPHQIIRSETVSDFVFNASIVA
jgi:hypothetical protein